MVFNNFIKNKNIIKKINGLLLLVFLLPILIFSGCSGSVDNSLIKAKKLIEYDADKYKDSEATGVLENGVRTINIKAYQFYFTPETIIVNKGEKIRLIVEAMDVPHGFEIEGFMIPDYNIETVIRKGFPLTIEFIADEEGVWEFICAIYCGFGHSTMKGTFVIR